MDDTGVGLLALGIIFALFMLLVFTLWGSPKKVFGSPRTWFGRKINENQRTPDVERGTATTETGNGKNEVKDNERNQGENEGEREDSSLWDVMTWFTGRPESTRTSDGQETAGGTSNTEATRDGSTTATIVGSHGSKVAESGTRAVSGTGISNEAHEAVKGGSSFVSDNQSTMESDASEHFWRLRSLGIQGSSLTMEGGSDVENGSNKTDSSCTSGDSFSVRGAG